LIVVMVAVVLAAMVFQLWPRHAGTHGGAAAPAAGAPAQSDALVPITPVAGIEAAPTETAAAHVLALRRDAAAGDPVAMRDLAELILRCGFGTSYGAGLWRQVETMSGYLKSEQMPFLRAAASRRGALCENIPGERNALALQYRQLLQDAAEQGDLLARLRQRSRAWGAEREAALPDDAEELVEDALISDDPRALYEIAFLYTAWPRAPVHAGIGSSRHDHTALLLLACERGLDCGVGSEHADDMCILGGTCAEGFDAMIWHSIQAEGVTRDVQARMQWLRTVLDEVDRAR
jgi:hypothetical protein